MQFKKELYGRMSDHEDSPWTRFGDEQPVCMRRLIDDVCSSFNEQQQRDLFSYWCSGYLLKTGSRNYRAGVHPPPADLGSEFPVRSQQGKDLK